jgi:hypothetical protein
MATKKGSTNSMYKASMDLYTTTVVILATIFFEKAIERFKQHRDAANLRFDKIVNHQ